MLKLFTLLILILGLSACSSKPVSPHYVKQNKYGFHVIGLNKNIYTLRFTGKPGTTAESAKQEWLEAASKICPKIQSNISNIKEDSVNAVIKSKAVFNSGQLESTTNMACMMYGASGCLLAGFMEVLLGEGYESSVNYPIVEGKIDCNET